MNINLRLDVKFKTELVMEGPRVIEPERYLCFRHAVFAVMHHKKKVEVEVGEYGGEYDMRNTECLECEKEYRNNQARGCDEEDS